MQGADLLNDRFGRLTKSETQLGRQASKNRGGSQDTGGTGGVVKRGSSGHVRSFLGSPAARRNTNTRRRSRYTERGSTFEGDAPETGRRASWPKSDPDTDRPTGHRTT